MRLLLRTSTGRFGATTTGAVVAGVVADAVGLAVGLDVGLGAFVGAVVTDGLWVGSATVGVPLGSSSPSSRKAPMPRRTAATASRAPHSLRAGLTGGGSVGA